ncbi:ATP-binding protein [Xylanimonas ulmi]|uniref:Putative ATPase n=1 Tax=Xylanimonas ulmi TaxID=228973 RepID=A0A4Q7M2Z4_9MICO|nr:BTAD domain-containing putative transcriptional regulator [Xylanibacterium ulmi]RZS61227.1 putative ATPase [Xylanibacterium ulmi]
MLHPTEPCVGVLGPVTVAGPDGGPRPPRGERAAALVVALALAGGRAVPAACLVEDLWTDGVPADPRAALQSLVSRLRATAGGAVVVARTGGYALNAPSDLDAAGAELDAARRALAHGAPADAAEAARRALARWRGTPGDGLGPSFEALAGVLGATAARLHDDLVAVHRQAAVTMGDHETVVALATPAFDADPTDEVAARDLLTSLGALGRRDEAARVFAHLRHALVTELGADPSPDLAALVSGLGPAPQTPAPARVAARTLRAAAQPLLGRDADVGAVLAALDTHRLVTILGPGGLGKTRLALEVAGRARDGASAEPPQVAVAELAGVRTDDDVPLALADALGIPATTSARIRDRMLVGDVRDQLVERVRSTPTLLVLDNCEHVVAGAAEWTDELLASAPGLRVLTTSRAPLQLAAEQVYAPAPLDARGAGAELFRRRATAARPGAHLPDDVVVRLVERLDGLPLAIELAAARVRTMSVEEIEAHLDERFALLRGGDRTAPERHRTLEAVIAWSWNLLEPAQQELWRRMAVLPDGFSARAAAVLGRLDPGARPLDALDDLDALVTQSIAAATDVPGGTRYRMLETVRELGLVRLDEAGEAPAVHAAMWAWATEVADRCSGELLGPGQLDALDEIAREHENLLFALRAAAAPATAPPRPGASAALRPDVVVHVFVALTGVWVLQGAPERAAGLASAVVEAATWWDVPRADRDRAALAFGFAGVSRGMEGGPGAARMIARLVRLLRVDDADPAGPAIGRRTRLVARTLLAALGRDLDEVVRLMGALRHDDDPFLVFMAYAALAQEAENDGRLADSVEMAIKAYEAAQPVGDVASRAFAAMLAASGLSEDGDSAAAIEWSSRARAGLGRLGTGDATRMLDWIDLAAALDRGDVEEAERLCDSLDTADGEGRGAGGVEQSAVVHAGRAEVAYARGDVDGALEAYRQARAALAGEEGPAAPWAIMMGAASAVRLAQAGRRAEALDAARDASRRAAAFMVMWAARGVDRPVLGTTCVGAAVALAQDAEASAADVALGLELWSLGEALGARQDLEALRRAPLRASLAARHGAALDAAAARVAALDRETQPARALALLESFAGPA